MVLTRVYNKDQYSDLSKFEDLKKEVKERKCYFCGGNHVCRECPQETMLAPILKKYIGKIMEDFIGDNFCCPSCSCRKLTVLGNHSPSLDIICTGCERKFEVKSKCLSVNNLPKDLTLPHGSFDDYKKRQEDGLDLFVIIYKVDRINKKITIREVLYARNKQIIKGDNIKVVKREKSNLSTIVINNKNLLSKLNLKKLFQFDFSSIIQNYIDTNNKYMNKLSIVNNYII